MLAATWPNIGRDAIDRLVGCGLTARQAEVYLLIFNTAMERGYQPSYRDIIEYLGATSLNAAKGHIDCLHARGWLRRNGSGNRSLRLLRTPDGDPFRGFICK